MSSLRWTNLTFPCLRCLADHPLLPLPANFPKWSDAATARAFKLRTDRSYSTKPGVAPGADNRETPSSDSSGNDSQKQKASGGDGPTEGAEENEELGDKGEDRPFKATMRDFKPKRFDDVPGEILDMILPPVRDERLSKIFRGCNVMNEGTWTIEYSRRQWQDLKYLYGDDRDIGGLAGSSIHPREFWMRLLRDPVVLTPASFDYWREKKDVDICRRFQVYDVDLQRSMGAELMCARFVASFGGKVKFHGFKDWFDHTNYRRLPRAYKPEFVCEAIDLSGTPLFYEGMKFLMFLKDLRYLNLSKCTALDEWAIARIYPLRDTLVHLNLSGCERITERGIISLWKFRNLRHLVLQDMNHIKNLPLVAMELEGFMPNCFISGFEYDKKPEPDFGISEDLFEADHSWKAECGGDIAKMDYEKFWNLDNKGFDADNMKNYVWRNRPYINDHDDLIKEATDAAGWWWRILTVNLWGPPRKMPTRRV